MIFIWDCILYFKILSPRMSPRIHAQNICILHSMLYPVTTVLLHLHWSCIVSSTVLMSVVLPSSDCQQESSLPSARDYDRWVVNHTSCSNCNSLANHTRSSRAQYFWGHKIDFGNTPLEGDQIIVEIAPLLYSWDSAAPIYPQRAYNYNRAMYPSPQENACVGALYSAGACWKYGRHQPTAEELASLVGILYIVHEAECIITVVDCYVHHQART